MAAWLRKGPSPHQTALAMIGAKPGDRVVIVGVDDTELLGELARITGLNGQTTACDRRPEARAEVEAVAAEAGVLIDFSAAAADALPLPSGSFDIAVFALAAVPPDDIVRGAVLRDAMRVVRPGGRLVMIDGVRRTGLFQALQRRRPRMTGTAILAALEQAGAKATRQLADVDGVAFYEGRRPSA